MTSLRAFFTAYSLFALTLAAPTRAAWPVKPIKIVIGFPAGGPLDSHMRLMSDKLATALGQPVIIDYKSGAGGAVGADSVAKATRCCWPIPAPW